MSWSEEDLGRFCELYNQLRTDIGFRACISRMFYDIFDLILQSVIELHRGGEWLKAEMLKPMVREHGNLNDKAKNDA